MASKDLLVVFLCLTSLSAQAGTCVKVVDGSGADDTYSFHCLKFDPAERQIAAKYDLRLGTSYKTAKQVLVAHGWVVDRTGLGQNASDHLPDGDLICGNGEGATCSVAFKKDQQHVYLTLRSQNKGAPLVGVSAKP